MWAAWASTNPSTFSTTCTGSESRIITWSSHVIFTPPTIPINLAVTATNPTTRPYVRPSETITFTLSTATVESVKFLVSYGDGTPTLLTTGNVVGHAWSTAGNYTVNVTAVTRSTFQTRLTKVTITDVAEGVAPENVLVKADWNGLADYNVTSFLTSYSPSTKQCTVNYGDRSPATTFDPATGFVFDIQHYHLYPGLGFYPVTLTCSNNFGTTSQSTIALGVVSRTLYENIVKSTDIVIPVNGGDGSVDNVQVLIDDVSHTVDVTITATHIVLSHTLFPNSGEHSVEVKSSTGVTLLKKIYNILTAVDGVRLMANYAGVYVNQTVDYTITISHGDRLFATLSYGDGMTELIYVPSAPATVTRRHSYLTLGTFNVLLSVANDVGSLNVASVMSVERPIQTASMTTTNVTVLGQPTTFILTVDPDVTPAMPVSVRFDYDDGTIETVTLGSMRPRAVPLVHTYTYAKYGIYRVKTTVQNNVSSTSLPMAILQVGQNVTAVDVYVDNWLVLVDQPVTLTIPCPTGSPIVLTVDMGDRLPPVRIARPSTYNSTTDDREYPVVNTLDNSTVVGPTRKRRDIGAATNGPFSVTYLYRNPGTYRVSVMVSNSLSVARSWLCPSIVVVSRSSIAPLCQLPVATIVNPSTLDNPLASQRSRNLTLTAAATLQCTGSPVSAVYTWTAERQMAPGVWRPELNVCTGVSASPNLLIPGNTLWYGTYRINVTVSLGSPSTLKSAPVSTFLTIVPSPLVASVVITDGQTDFEPSSVVNLNVSASLDPDVSTGNMTGVQIGIFCYPETAASAYQHLTLPQLLAARTHLAVNSTEGNVDLYQFGSQPCFVTTTPNVIWIMGLEVVFSASALITDDAVVFSVFVTKDSRVANATLRIRVWAGGMNATMLDNIDELLRKGDTNAALMVINLVTGMLNGDEDEEAKNERSKLRGKLIGALGKVSDNLHNMDQIEKTTDVMSTVTSKGDEVKPQDKANAAGAVGKAAAVAKEFAESASADKVASVSLGILNSVGNILPIDQTPEQTVDSYMTTVAPAVAARRRRRNAAPTTPAPKFIGSEPESSDNETTCCGNCSGLCEWVEPVGFLCVDEDDRKKTVWSEDECLMIHPDDLKIFKKRFDAWLEEQRCAANAIKKAITTNGMGGIGDIGGVLVGKQGEGNAQSLSTPTLNMTVMKVGEDSGSGLQMDGYSLPAEAVANVSGGGGFMVLTSPNAFTYSNSSVTVSSPVITMSLTGADGLPIQVSNSSEPFELWMDGIPDEPEMLNFSFLSTPTGNTYNYHRVTVNGNNSAVFAILRPINSIDSFYVYLKYNDYPNDTFNDWVGVIPNPDFDPSDPARFQISPPQNLTAINGTYRFGIRLHAARISVEQTSKSNNYSYSMYVYSAACRYWSDELDAWDTAGCSVDPIRTTPQRTLCLCTHLTSFGGDCAVPPNTIDFKTVFTAAKFLESVPVFSTVISLIVIYLVIVVWARHMDKKDVARWGATPLEDNLPSDTYHYQLSVYTGVKKSAGTNSKPSFILSGDYADTGVRRLFDGKRKEIPTGSIYNYILSVESCLGPLTFLRIWHDNSGTGTKRGWFLDQMQIVDLQTGEKFFFICDRWMAVEEDDGMIERILPVAGTSDLTQFKHLFNNSVRKKFSNDHLWVSVFSRPTRSSFTRVQRVSSCVALLFLTMIVNCMFFKAGDPDHATEVHIGPITLTAQQLFISVVSTCIVMPPSVAIITIFSKARPKSNAVTDKDAAKGTKKSRWMALGPGSSSMWSNAKRSRMEKMRDAIHNIMTSHQRAKYADDDEEQTMAKKKKKFTLPHWTIYIAWTLVFLCIVLSGFFTILYSMQWGRLKSVDWLTTFLMSFFQNVIVVQPIKVVLLVALISCVLRKPDTDDDEGPSENELRPDEEFMNRSERDIQEIMKQRRQSHAEIDRPNIEKLKAAREQRLQEIQMDAIIRECIIYLFFVLVVYFISYQERDKRSFLFAQNIKRQFFGGSPAFADIQSYSDVYSWVNQTLMPNLYSSDWYNGDPMKSWRDIQTTSDRVTIRLGTARIRQLRIKEDTCKIVKKLRGVINHCRADYNWIDDDAKDYAPGWQPLGKSNLSEQCLAQQKKYDVWRYRNTLELKGSPYMGQVNTYKGGGYVFNFRRDPRVTSAKLAELEAGNWLDVRTRGVLAEFTLYNGNVNLYGSVIMLVEFLATGGPVVTQEVKVFRLTSYIGPFGIVVILFQVIYLCFILYFFIHVIQRLRKLRLGYFKEFWNLLEFCTVIMGIITIAMYGMKMIFGNMAMSILKESGSGAYVNFVTIGVWDETYGFILATVVFLSTIKFINMLKFNRRMSLLTDTVRLAAKDMKAFVVTFFIYFFAFCQFGYLLFGSVLPEYASFVNTIEALFSFSIGSFDFVAFKNAQPFLGPIFFFLFIAIIFIGMQTMFLTIICEAFAIVRANLATQKNDYEVVDYVVGKFKGLFGMGSSRGSNGPPQQQDDEEKEGEEVCDAREEE